MFATAQAEKYGYEWGIYRDAAQAVYVLCAAGETMTEPADPRNTTYQEEHAPKQDALEVAAQEHDVEYSAIGQVLFNKTVQLALGESALPDNDWVLDAYATIAVPLKPIKTSDEELAQELIFQRVHVGSQMAGSKFDLINNGKQSRIYHAHDGQLALRVVPPKGTDYMQHIADYDTKNSHDGDTRFKIGPVYGDGPGISRAIPEYSWRYMHVAGLMLDAYAAVQEGVTSLRTSFMVFDTAKKLSTRLDAR